MAMGAIIIRIIIIIGIIISIIWIITGIIWAITAPMSVAVGCGVISLFIIPAPIAIAASNTSDFSISLMA